MNDHPLTTYPYTHLDRFTLVDDPFTNEQEIREGLIKEGMPQDAIENHIQRVKDSDIYQNETYQAIVKKDVWHGFQDGLEVWHLSIKRLDKTAVHDWRDLMAIKNDIVGPEYEAVELYPSVKRLVDSANQYHLWVFKSSKDGSIPMIPLGFMETLTNDGDKEGKGVFVNTGQRPFSKTEKSQDHKKHSGISPMFNCEYCSTSNEDTKLTSHKYSIIVDSKTHKEKEVLSCDVCWDIRLKVLKDI